MPSEARKQLEKRRLNGAKLLRAGCCVAEVARRLEVSWSAVSKWEHALRAKEPAALRSPHNQFRKPRLGQDQLRRIAWALRRPPKQSGFIDCKAWTLPVVAQLIGRIAQYYGGVSRFTARRVLHCLGFRCERKVYRPRKDAEEVREHWLPSDPCGRGKVCPKLGRGARADRGRIEKAQSENRYSSNQVNGPTPPPTGTTEASCASGGVNITKNGRFENQRCAISQ